MIDHLRTYSELIELDNFRDRLSYLMLNDRVGEETFGFDRYLNQKFYRSKEWRDIRREVILRDNGCDLGIDGLEIHGKIIIHHMNPIAIQDIRFKNEDILNPEYLITVAKKTHDAIHYGYDNNIYDPTRIVIRKPGDTCLWKK